jgi:uncharacterized membrane protein
VREKGISYIKKPTGNYGRWHLCRSEDYSCAGINPPKPECSQAHTILPGQIFHLFSEIFLFIIAFLILAGFWLDHHRQFHFVSTIDSRLLWINIFLLISVVLIPFSTDVAGDYPEVQVAVLLFSMNS